jgi:hypothetical protein
MPGIVGISRAPVIKAGLYNCGGASSTGFCR